MICDLCKSEIVHENADDQFLRLESHDREGGGCVTDMAIEPEISGPKTFCGMRCLVRWAKAQISPFTGKNYD